MNLKTGFSGTDQRGQVLIESLLLAIVSLGLLMAALNYLKGNKTLDKVVNVAWVGVAQMAEFGTWPSGAPARPMDHPNSKDRVRTLDPKNF